jgi:hypothetical protein
VAAERVQDHRPPFEEETAMKKIRAEMCEDKVAMYSCGPFPFIPYVVESDHPRFTLGTRLDWGFVQCALQDGYDLTIEAPKDAEVNAAIAAYEEKNGKAPWISWRRL